MDLTDSEIVTHVIQIVRDYAPAEDCPQDLVDFRQEIVEIIQRGGYCI